MVTAKITTNTYYVLSSVEKMLYGPYTFEPTLQEGDSLLKVVKSCEKEAPKVKVVLDFIKRMINVTGSSLALQNCTIPEGDSSMPETSNDIDLIKAVNKLSEYVTVVGQPIIEGENLDEMLHLQ